MSDDSGCSEFHFPTVADNGTPGGQLYLKLNNGTKMPMIGLGTSQSADDALRKAVRAAFSSGYRLIDTAANYQNEEAIGLELEALFKEGVIKRQEIFVTTKLPPNSMGRDDPVKMLKKQLEKLKLDYVDLYLIHWPFPIFNDGTGNPFPIDQKTGRLKMDYTKHYTETWTGMEDVYRLGLAKAIGLSNFNSRQVEDVLLRADILPAVLQIESHPYLSNSQLIQWCQKRNIAVTAYSPFANPGNIRAPVNSPKYPRPMEDETLRAIAAKYPGKSVSQVLLRWQIQRGVAVVPKSNTEERIKANLNVFDFELSCEDMQAIGKLNRGVRIWSFAMLGVTSSRDYPFDDYRDVADPWA